MSEIKFFMSMIPPTVTAQEHKVTIKNGRPLFYDPPELKAARDKLTLYLRRNKPKSRLLGAVELRTTWFFPKGKNHKNGEWRITKPDTDNLQKLLKDCMTKCGFWKDDAQVARENTEKFWSDTPEIYIEVKQLEDFSEKEGEKGENKLY